ncbi:MAG TPA: hypothetical protein VII81_05800, partial [Terriglobales bacterium]
MVVAPECSRDFRRTHYLCGPAAEFSGHSLLRYRLIRIIGRALGLDWSQANDTLETNKPASPSAAGYP